MSERAWPSDSSDSLSDFSEEIRRRPLLTAEDEIRLGTAVRVALASAQVLIARFPDSAGAVQTLVDQSLWAEVSTEVVDPVPEEIILGSAGPITPVEIELSVEIGEINDLTPISEPTIILPDVSPVTPDILDVSPVSPDILDILDTPVLPATFVAEAGGRKTSGHAHTRASSLNSAENSREAAALRARLEKVTLDELLSLVAEGRRAHTSLVEANLRLVFSIGRRYARPSYPLEDIVQDGAVGLMRAAWKYDPSSGNRFSTYATWWIRQGMTRALSERSRAIRLPVHVGEQLRSIGQVAERLRAHLGRPPTEAELARETNIPVARLAELRMVGAALVSLDSPVGDNAGTDAEGNTLGAILADPTSEEDFGGAANNDLRRQLAGALADLQVREREILTLRYGLDESGQARTLEEVGKILGITRERVRQIEAKALRKLRHPRVGQRLRDFL